MPVTNDERRIYDACRAAVDESGLSATAYGEAAGVGGSNMARYARGKVMPNALTLMRIARASKDPVAFMLMLVDEKPEWTDVARDEALEACLPLAKSVFMSMAQLHDKPIDQFSKLHAAMAAVYILSFDAGRVAGYATGRAKCK